MLPFLQTVLLPVFVAGITEITEHNFERTLQDGDPWIIQFGSPDDQGVSDAITALEKWEKSTNGLANVGFYSIKDSSSFRLATLLNLPSLRDLYCFNCKHNVTQVPENTWVFPLPCSTPIPFGIGNRVPTEERIAQWGLENTPTRAVDYTTMCLEPVVEFLDSPNKVSSISGNTVIFLNHPNERMMHLSRRYNRSARFVSLCNKTNLRNALPGGPTMPASTACVIMGDAINPPKTFSGEIESWLSDCINTLEAFAFRKLPTKEVNRRRRMATMASLQSNVTEIGDVEAFRRVASPPLAYGGLAIAFFTPSLETHDFYMKHFNALATKYMGVASDGKNMPMRFFYINAEVHPGIARHMGVEKIPSLVCLLPASESRMAQTSYEGQFESEPMKTWMLKSMMQNQDAMREYSLPENPEKLQEYFSSSALRSYPTEMQPCVHCDEAVQRGGLFYPSKEAPRAETVIDKSQSKKYLNIEAERERQQKKKEARNARMKGRERANDNKTRKRTEL